MHAAVAERPVSAGEVVDFWFSEESREHWFRSTPDYDARVRSRFEAAWELARDGALVDWEQTADGALALVILLDQMPLNMFRDQPAGFSTEALSRTVAERAIARGFGRDVAEDRRAFFYLPYMHSELLADQDRSVELFSQPGYEQNLKWARHHREIVQRFGRFPHRNAILGRASTPGETEWLDSPDAFNP
jgi:uncharacterized protein (DUF924 family)